MTLTTDPETLAPRIRVLSSVDDAHARQLADVLVDCVEGGASVSFMLPLTRERASAFWRRVGEGVERGDRLLLVAEDAQGIVGTVQLLLEMPENQPHRAEVAKMLVHRRARRQGIGALLMQAAGQLGRERAKTLLVLDTSSAEAERLYARLGWTRLGLIPDFALLPDGRPCDTTYFYRALA